MICSPPTDTEVAAAATVMFPMLATLREPWDDVWWQRALDQARRTLERINADRADFMEGK